MRHRASRPFLDLWRRLPHAIARPIGAATRLGPRRALVAVLVMLGLGAGAFVAVASVGDGPTGPSAASTPVDRTSAPTSRGDERPELADGATPPDGGPAPTSSTTSSTPTPGEPEPSERDRSTSSAPSVPPDVPTGTGQATGQATGSAGVRTTPSGQRVTASSSRADRTAPDTTVSKQQPDGDSVVLTFSASEPSSFACSLDGAAYTFCSSPETYDALESGWHTFAVRATDAAGNVDPTPAQVRWLATAGSRAHQ